MHQSKNAASKAPHGCRRATVLLGVFAVWLVVGGRGEGAAMRRTILLLCGMVLLCCTASALTGYTYDDNITISNAGSGLTYYQYNFTIDSAALTSAGTMQADGGDCRIADASSNLLSFWNETAFNTASTKIWVNATSLPNGDTTHHLCYGNATANAAYNGTTTFPFFDDFNRADSPTVGNGWNETVDAWAIRSHVLFGIDAIGTLDHNFTFDASYIVHGKIKRDAMGRDSSIDLYGNVADRRCALNFYDGDIRYLDSVNWQSTGKTFVPDTWYPIEITFHPTAGNTDYRLLSLSWSIAGVSPFSGSYTNIFVLSQGSTGSGNMSSSWDDIYVRKYAATLPTVSVASSSGAITGVHGFVYEGVTQTNTPIPSVAVLIYNSTWSDMTGTDTSGYYTFTNLSNTTYSISFKKDRYVTVEYQYTTPPKAHMYRKDIWMQKETPPFYIRHFVTFQVCNIFGTRYADVAIICYLHGTSDKSGTTGADGTKTFDLYEDTEYRITFINATQGINKEIMLTPREEYYYIYIDSFDWTPPENQTIRDTINWYWTSERINVTHGWINFTYTDSANETTAIDYWIDSSNNTNLYSFDTTYPESWTVNQIVEADNKTYIVHFSGAHPRFDSLIGSVEHTISFHGLRVDFGWGEQWQYNTVAVCAIIFIGLLFSATSANVGAVVCAMSGWMFMWMGWLSGSTINYGLMVLATIIAVGFAMRKGERLTSP